MNNQLTLILIASVVGWLLVTGGRKLMKSSNEGARRVKMVVLGVVVLIAGAFAVEAFGPGGTVVAVAILGVIFWVTKGFKQK